MSMIARHIKIPLNIGVRPSLFNSLNFVAKIRSRCFGVIRFFKSVSSNFLFATKFPGNDQMSIFHERPQLPSPSDCA